MDYFADMVTAVRSKVFARKCEHVQNYRVTAR